MRGNRWDPALALGIFVAFLLACSATTANISSLKIASDEQGKNETRNFKPGEKVYAIAQIANNPGKVQAKFRIVVDEVEGQQIGTVVPGTDTTLDIEGSRPAIFWITLPARGFQNGRYKLEVTMLTESGDQKDQESATFDISGY